MKIDPVFRAVGFPSDQKRQGKKSERHSNHHKPEMPYGPERTHEIDTDDHADQSDTVIDHLVVSEDRIGIIENQNAQRTEKIGQ